MDVQEPGRRRTIRVSGLTKKQAEDVHRRVENVVSARLQRVKLDDSDAAWLGSLTDKFHAKLVNVGLDQPREKEEMAEAVVPVRLLSEFLDDHIDHGRTSHGKAASESTLAKWRSTQRFLNEQFPGRTLESITPEDAHQFRVWLDKRKIRQTTSPRKGEPMAENGKRKHIANCKAFFNAATRRGLIDRNPFEAQLSTTGVDHRCRPQVRTAPVISTSLRNPLRRF